MSVARQRAVQTARGPAPAGPAAPRPVARCAAGEFRGGSALGADFWKGIRYAVPPVGPLRWRAPRAAPAVTADALAFGSACPQPSNWLIGLGDGIRQDEDCLFLNVWRPSTASADERLPVMVWIHGGAYALGSSSQPLYDGTALATGQGLVVVTLNYRLGAFGFLELGAFSRAGAEFDGNLGLRDVLLALAWVRDNIAAFGGDPQRVTIAGESSGGGLVTALLSSPAARGLFSRAIMQSSPASSIYGARRAESVAARFLSRLGLRPDEAAGLRDIDAGRIVETAQAIYAEVPAGAPGTVAFAPVVDGELLPETPVDVLRRGGGAPVPLIAGTNDAEASVFRYVHSPIMPVTDAQIVRMFANIRAEQPLLDLPPVERVLDAYASLGRRRGLAIARDIAFRLPTLWVVEGHSRVAATWLYRFDQTPPMLRALRLGATHASELAYVWGNLRASRSDPSFRLGGLRTGRLVSARMQARWGAFVRGEEPDSPEAIDWPRFATGRATLVVDRADRVVDDLDGPMLDAWGTATLAFR